MCRRVVLTIECRHGINPFSEIINHRNDVLMTLDQGGITSHEVHRPLAQGNDCDHEMQRCERSPCFWGKSLTTATVFNCMDAIGKDGRPKITGMDNLLGNNQTREVATRGSTVIVIQYFFSLIMGEEMTRYGIDALMVQEIPYDDIESRLVSNALMIFVA